MLYHPVTSNATKYQKFYAKLTKYLVESSNLIENISVRTQDGFVLDTLYVKNPHTDRCIIFFHGNAGNLSMRYDMIKFLYNFGSVVIFDYRSYGRSTGNITHLTEEGLYQDGYAMWKYVTSELKYEPNKITLFGESLGCSIVIKLAADLSKTFNNETYPHSLILNSPFSSLSSIVNHMFNKYNYGFLESLITFVELEYDSIEWIKYVSHTIKIIIAHSPNDEIIPYPDARKLYHSVHRNPNIKFIDIHGEHNDIGLTTNYVYSVSEMLQE
uniref:Serine aminopeptidase S33 domain-containing protein n=1 Tax=viral metagenome TaxID=1070528 RepID=A0A6C0C6I4_9ZZZZ